MMGGVAKVTALTKEQAADSPAPDGEKEESWDGWKRDISFKRGTAFPVAAPAFLSCG